MRIIKICPKCNAPVIRIANETADSILENKITGDIFACVNKICNVAYFTDNGIYEINKIKTKLWYKDDNENINICYCSNITRKEIKNAIDNNCNSISEVQEYLNKNRTGHCKKENPMGECCKHAFEYEINKYKKNK